MYIFLHSGILDGDNGGKFGKKMEGLMEKVEGRLEKMEGRIEELVMEGKILKEDKEDVPVSCLYVINVYDFFLLLVHAQLQCLNAVYGKCFKPYICLY